MANAGEPLGDVANRLLFENEVVRVWEMDLAPGERSDRHRHDLPYLLSSSRARASTPTSRAAA